MDKNLKKIIYILEIFFLILLILYFLGINFNINHINFKEKHILKTNVSCTQLKQENIENYGEFSLSIFSTELDIKCQKLCGNYNKLINLGDCSEENLICNCDK